MKKFLLRIWYTILYQFDQHRDSIPAWWYEGTPLEGLPKHLQRVKIAEDVILQIKAKKYYPNQGAYIASIKNNDDEEFSTRDDIKNKFEEIKTCKTCALGACILSLTKFKNKLNFYDIEHFNVLSKNSKVQQLLLTTFTPKQLALIETTFEGQYGYNNRAAIRIAKRLEDHLQVNHLTLEECDACSQFYYNNNSSARHLLIAIMQNIIDNNGDFKP